VTAPGGIPPDLLRRARGLVVEGRGPGRYAVFGGSAPHLVEIDGDTRTCDCGDFAFRGRVRPCKHIAAVWLSLERPPERAS